jgi:hypothetical protein
LGMSRSCSKRIDRNEADLGAANNKLGPGHKGRLIRQKKQDGFGDVLWRTGLHIRANHIDANPGWREFAAGCPHEAHNAPHRSLICNALLRVGGGRNRNPQRCCQTNSNQSQFARKRANLCGTKKPPLGKGRGAVEFEVLSRVETALLVEMV